MVLPAVQGPEFTHLPWPRAACLQRRLCDLVPCLSCHITCLQWPGASRPEIHSPSLRNLRFHFAILLYKWISFCISILYSQLKVYKWAKTSRWKYYFNFQLNYTSRALNTQQIELLRCHVGLKLKTKIPFLWAFLLWTSRLRCGSRALSLAVPHVGHSEQGQTLSPRSQLGQQTPWQQCSGPSSCPEGACLHLIKELGVGGIGGRARTDYPSPEDRSGPMGYGSEHPGQRRNCLLLDAS